jgi:tetratricopeptide (TPR) repeat protein
MAKAFERLGKWKPAQVAYQRALFPANASADLASGNEGIENLLSYANVSLKLGQVNVAYDALTAAIALVNAELDKGVPPLAIPARTMTTPSDMKSYIALGFALKNTYGTHQFKDALPFLDAALLLKPRLPAIHLHKGRLMQILHRPDEARNAYLQAAKFDTGDGAIRSAALEAVKGLR